MEIWTLLLGIGIGVVVTGVAFDRFSRRKPAQAKATMKLTTGWRLSELRDPRVVAHDVGPIDVPENTTILASGTVDPGVQTQSAVKQVEQVRATFAIDGEGRRALLFSGGLQEGSLAAWTTEPEILQRLETEYRSLSARADDYVERRRIADLAGRNGVIVEVTGLVQDVLPYHDKFMIRLEDQGSIIGVIVEKDASELRDGRIRVLGKLEKDRSGYSVITARDIRQVR